MKHKILGSSSSGNAVLYHNEILVDCGITYKKIKPFLDDIKIILLTHTHQDHTRIDTIEKISQSHPNIKWLVPNWLYEQLEALNVKLHEVKMNVSYKIGKYQIIPIKLYHNVSNCGYRILTEDYKIIHATDTCTLEGITAKDYDLYAIEHNWDENTINDIIREKQDEGIYPYEAEAKNNHLSMQEAEKFINANKKESSKTLKLHISQKYIEKDNKYFIKGLKIE